MRLLSSACVWGILNVVACSGSPSGSGAQSTGPGGSPNAPATGCSSDGTEQIVAGTYVETFGTGVQFVQMFVSAPTCAFCAGNAPVTSDGLRWRSEWNADRSKIMLTLLEPDGGIESSASWWTPDGTTFNLGNMPLQRDDTSGLTCGGVGGASGGGQGSASSLECTNDSQCAACFGCAMCSGGQCSLCPVGSLGICTC